MLRDLEPEQWAGLYSALDMTDTTKYRSAAQMQDMKSPEKGHTMRHDKGHQNPIVATGTGEIPVIAEKPVINGEISIVGADQAAKKLEAQIPGFDDDAKPKSHDKGHMQAERGFMAQHGKPSQPHPRWNLPRR